MQQAAIHQDHTTTNLSKADIEKQQEEELMAKYPSTCKGSAFLQKKMQGKVKYFDSGDYNMALSKKSAVLKNQGQSQNPHSAAPPSNSSGECVPSETAEQQTTCHATPQTDPPTEVSSSSGYVRPELPHQTSAYSPPVALLCAATPTVAKEFLVHHQISQFEEAVAAAAAFSPTTSSGSALATSSTSNSPTTTTNTGATLTPTVLECTGDTMATPDNVPAVRRKSVLLSQAAAGSRSAATGNS